MNSELAEIIKVEEGKGYYITFVLPNGSKAMNFIDEVQYSFIREKIEKGEKIKASEYKPKHWKLESF